VTTLEVTAQVKLTMLLKPPMDVTSMVAVATSPGSTALGCMPEEELREKPACPWARDTWAAENAASRSTKMNARRTGLGFDMSGLELTTFDSSEGAKAARTRTKECRPLRSAAKSIYMSPVGECAKQES